MLKTKNYILFCILSLISLSAMAQRPTVRATIEPSDIMIGEQAVINLEVISPKGRNIIFPVYTDTLIHGIELLQMAMPDTTMTELMTLNQKYLVTSFDSALYHIPHMLVIVDGTDSILSNGFGFKVSSPQLSEQTLEYLDKLNKEQVDSIDFVQLELADVKDIQPAPFVWTDYLLYIIIPLILWVLIAASIVAYYFWRKKKNKGYFFTPKVIESAHVIALRELDTLKAKKLSQQGMEKVYYTDLSGILRTYIAKRYSSINAPEMITEDIIQAIHRQTESRSPEQGLKQILELADLVKFAKYTPLQDENDLSMVNSYLFVNQTKLEEIQDPVKDGEKNKAGKQNTNQASNEEQDKEETNS